MPLPLVVFSHLRWEFVYQRPQHVLSRLAQSRPVIVVEEPVFDEGPAHWERQTPAPGVTVLRPHTAVREGGFSDAQLAALRPLVAELGEEVGPCDAWFYTPLALPLLPALDGTALDGTALDGTAPDGTAPDGTAPDGTAPDGTAPDGTAPDGRGGVAGRGGRVRAVVYDCMDELSAFDHAPPALLDREADLLARADLVFTGGPSLYRAKRDRHPSVHCFPSSVDAAHFGQARPDAAPLAEPDDQREIPRPRLGFFGVIDERLDRDLVGALAAARPDWHVVMLGPVIKIDPASLPQAPNLHWLGGKSYDALPAYLAGWDVCLLPFARNRATEFISPTKTLEYMAAERPIVSTPITDVADPYGDVVYLADTPDDFVAACASALRASPRRRAETVADMRAVLATTSWDATVGRMAALLDGLPARAAHHPALPAMQAETL